MPDKEEFEVEIPVRVRDDTDEGTGRVRDNVNRMSEDVSRGTDRIMRDTLTRAQTSSRGVEAAFRHTSEGVRRETTGALGMLERVFNSHNFLLRSMAREAGYRHAAIAIGIGKLGLAYKQLAAGVEETTVKSSRELEQLVRTHVVSYNQLADLAGTLNVRNAEKIEQFFTGQISKLERGLMSATLLLQKAEAGMGRVRAKIQERMEDFAGRMDIRFGGKIDTAFLTEFSKATTDLERWNLLLPRFGRQADLAFQPIQRAAQQFKILERNAAQALKVAEDRVRLAGGAVKRYNDELALARAAMDKFTASAGGSSRAVGGLSAGLVTAGGAVAAVVVAILAAIAVFALFTAAVYKSTTAAAEYGNEIYKLEKATGLSANTLSVLSAISKETGQNSDALARTFARLEVQISRGLVKPTSEAGRALKTLKLDFEDLKRSTPDQQVMKVSKAFNELNNQNTKAHVASILLSRDYEKQADTLTIIAEKYTETQEKVKRFGLMLDEQGAVKAHMFTVALNDVSLAWQGLWISVGQKILPQMAGLMLNITELLVNQRGEWTFLGKAAETAVQGMRLFILSLRDAFNSLKAEMNPVWAMMVFFTGWGKRMEQINAEDRRRAEDIARETAKLEEAARRAGGTQFAEGKGPKTDLEKLEDQLRRITFQIDALQKVGSREFVLKFKIERFQQVHSDLESILKLRHKLNLQFDEPLPFFDTKAGQATQEQQVRRIRDYLEQLQRFESVFDAIRQTANEQADAMAKLAQVQQQALMPVVDALTRSETKYFEAVRARMNAEQELTAEVMSQARIRADRAKDEVGETIKAYQTLRLELGKTQDEQETTLRKNLIFLQAFRGGTGGIQDQIRERLEKIDRPTTPTAIQTIATYAANIDKNVGSIALHMTGAASTIETLGQAAVTGPGQAAGLPGYGTRTQLSAEEQLAGSYSKVTMVPRGQAVELFQSINKLQETLDAMPEELLPPDVLVGEGETARVEQFVKQVELKEQILRESYDRINGERVSLEREAIQTIIDENFRLNNQLIDFDLDLARARAVNVSAREREIRQIVINSTILMEEQTTYFSDRAQAKWFQFLASQKGVTDIITDASIGAFETTFNVLGRGLDKVLGKLGIAKDLVRDILLSWLRLAATQWLAPRQTGGGGGGVTGTLSQILGGIFGQRPAGQPSGGGGGFGGFGGFNPLALTGGFGGGASPAASFISGGGLNQFLGAGAFFGLGTELTAPAGGAATLASLGAGAAGATGAAAAAQGFTLAGFGASLAPLAPLAGLGLGYSIGGGGLPGVLGALGGLGLGAAGAVALLGGAGAPIFASGGALASLGPVAGFLMNPFVIGAGAALLIGAYFWNRSRQRRRDEQLRSQILGDSKSKLQEILANVNADRIDGVDALAQAGQIRADYLTQVGQIKDKKTRRIAEQTVRELDAIIVQIRAAVDKQDKRREFEEKFVPTFSGGGRVYRAYGGPLDRLIKVQAGERVVYPMDSSGRRTTYLVPGANRGYDNVYMYAPVGSVVIPRGQQTVGNYAMGGTVDNGGSGGPRFSVSVKIDAAGIVSVGIKDQKNQDQIIESIQTHVIKTREDGLLGTLDAVRDDG